MYASLPPLIQALHEPARYPHAVGTVDLIETHISWVLLAGDYAYKIKKPVDLGFLDFSTLDKRRHFCHEELRLNRRLAPQLYLGVIPIGGTSASPVLGGEPAFEYAVKMVRFPQEARLDRVAERGELRREHVDRLAAELADFHRRTAVAPPDSPFGTPENVYAPMLDNFAQIRARVPATYHAQLTRLEECCAAGYTRLAALLAERRAGGFVRECHGDAHLANMVLAGDDVGLFDCIEFNDGFRWIDVLNEIAFTVMDLADRGHAALGRRLLNRYLEITGDYAGMRLFRFYQAYRAMVRAKVAAIRLAQPGLDDTERAQSLTRYASYADLAERYAHDERPALIVTHGVAGSGKTTVTGALIEADDYVRVRSDIERKRLHGLSDLARSGSMLDGGIYTAAAGAQTYDKLAEIGTVLLEAGCSVLVDATFLRRDQRDRLRAVADAASAPFVILSVQAPEETLVARVAARAHSGGDASEADGTVLQKQLAALEPLNEAERCDAVFVDTGAEISTEAIAAQLARRTGRR
jgi:uncharacterized protein